MTSADGSSNGARVDLAQDAERPPEVLTVRPGVSPTVRYVTLGAAAAAVALLVRLLRRG